ncbi:MobA/MobL family protein [Novosphingopyxis sp.]|uniref:MobA/MobL family protein n=1 Tax=Novosphingopyxis sp. TaxID=2709690 RepID=UPI003B5ABC55
MVQIEDAEKWRKANAGTFDRIMKNGRTARRKMSGERTPSKAVERAANIKAATAARADREHVRSVRKVMKYLGLSANAKAWGRHFRVRSTRASGGRKKRTKEQHLRPSKPRSGMPKYARTIRDTRGRVAIFFRYRYVGFKSKKWRAGLAGDHANYLMREDGIEAPEIQLSKPISNVIKTPAEAAAFWDAVEEVEGGYRANARVQERIIVNLPDGMTPRQRRRAAKKIGENCFGRYGLPYHAVVHLPDPKGDERNFHVHIVASLRPSVRLGDHEWAFAEEKVNGLTTPEGLLRMRAVICATLNRECRRAGLESRYAHRTYRDRGIDADRTEHIGPERVAAFEKGEKVGAIQRNAAQIALNTARVESQALQAEQNIRDQIMTIIRQQLALAKRKARAKKIARELEITKDSVDTLLARQRKVAGLRRLNNARSQLISVMTAARAAQAGLAVAKLFPANLLDRLFEVSARAVNMQGDRLKVRSPAIVQRAVLDVASSAKTMTGNVPRPVDANVILRILSIRAGTSELIGSTRVRKDSLELGKVREQLKRLAAQARSLSKKHSIKSADQVPQLRNELIKITAHSSTTNQMHSSSHKNVRPLATTLRPSLAAAVQSASEMPAAVHRAVGKHSISDLRNISSIAGSALLSQRSASKPSLSAEMRKTLQAIRGLALKIRLDRSPPAKVPISVAAALSLVSDRALKIRLKTGNSAPILSTPVSGTTKMELATIAAQAVQFRQSLPDHKKLDRKLVERLIATEVSKSRGAVAPIVPLENPSAGSVRSKSNSETSDDQSADAAKRPLDYRIDRFAASMGRSRCELVMAQDSVVEPKVAIIRSWDLTRRDIASPRCQELLLRQYIHQQIEADQLELELGRQIKTSQEAFGADLLDRAKLSARARATAEAHYRDGLFAAIRLRIVERSFRGKHVPSREDELRARGVRVDGLSPWLPPRDPWSAPPYRPGMAIDGPSL